MKFYIYDAATGNVLMRGDAPEKGLASLGVPGKRVVAKGEIAEGYRVDPDSGTPVALDPIGATAPTTAAVGVPSDWTVPDACSVWVDDEPLGDFDPGSNTLEFPEPGTARVKLTATGKLSETHLVEVT